MVIAATPSACSTDPKQATARLAIIGRSANGSSSSYARAAACTLPSSRAASTTPYMVTSQLLDRGRSARLRPRSVASAPAAARSSPAVGGGDGVRGHERVVHRGQRRRVDHLLEQRQQLRQPALVPADRHQLRAVPPVGVGVAGLDAALAALVGELLGLGQPPVPDRQHDLDRLRHELDRGVVLLGQQRPQLAQAPLAVRVGVEEQVGDQPDQAHREVAAVPGPGRLADQLVGDRRRRGAVLGAEQAVVGQAQRLHAYQWIRRRRAPRARTARIAGVLRRAGSRTRPRTRARSRRPRALAGSTSERTWRSRASIIAAAVAVAVLVHPRPVQPEHRLGHHDLVAGAFALQVGRLEPGPAGPSAVRGRQRSVA